MAYEDHIDQYQAARDRDLPGDADPILLTRFEAEKCSAVIDGYLGGLELYEDAVRAVAYLLRARALEGVGGRSVPSAEESWQVIDQVPWPPPRQKWPKPNA